MKNNPMHKNIEVKCLAKTRNGTLCQTAPVKDKKRCRMHGGAKGSGAPKGNKNAFKHGFYKNENVQKRNEIKQLIKEIKQFTNNLGF